MSEDGRILDVSHAFQDFDETFFSTGGVARLRSLVESQSNLLPEVDTDEVRTGPCIARPHQVICLGLNYRDHADEVGEDAPNEPIVFNKAPNTVVGPFDDVCIPPGQVQVDWEVELSIVISRRCRYLASPDEASNYIAGYCISNDVSERVFQLQRGGQWVKGKSFETFNPCGPWLATPDEVDPRALELRLWVNGELMQSATTKQMIFDVDYTIWYLSQFMVLMPGDLINTGTPPGVGMAMDPPRFLSPGDVMELEITGLGSQRQTCIPAPQQRC